jgi:DNA mismatch repair ATPase MutL
MKDLSLHILDIAQNSISAGASLIEIKIVENSVKDTYELIIKDNGKGMNSDTM